MIRSKNNILTKKYNTNKKVRINDTNIGTDKVDNNVNIDEMKQMVTWMQLLTGCGRRV